MDLYRTEQVLRACDGLTRRMLDYWVERGVIDPERCFHSARSEKRIYLFSFENIVQIRLVKSLRDTGLPLQRIRPAIKRLKSKRGKSWHSAWLITDGRKIYEDVKDPSAVRSLVNGEVGQLVFAVVAVKSAQNSVKKRLKSLSPIDLNRYDGDVRPWEKRA